MTRISSGLFEHLKRTRQSPRRDTFPARHMLVVESFRDSLPENEANNPLVLARSMLHAPVSRLRIAADLRDLVLSRQQEPPSKTHNDDRHPPPDDPSQAVTIQLSVATAGIAAAFGPVLGGFLVGALSWRGIFLINVPIGVLGYGLTLAFVPQPPRLAPQGLDPPAQALAILGPGMLTFALIEEPALGWMHPLILLMFSLFILAAVLFILREKRAASPMLPLNLFASATFSASNLVGLLLNFGFYGQFFVINLYFPHIQGYSPLLTGLALLPESCMVFAGSMLAGWITGRTGPRLPMMLGLAISGFGMLGMSLAQVSTAYLLLCRPCLP
ncbi:MFS transporter [Ktedonobacter racemifer]|uniref:MFS transporter n=1 Tax=Ktedonobacter racemifer TaxID=363277 RepID=UPI0006986490|nr:MFS transporter [Ktedonobacter racemifer]